MTSQRRTTLANVALIVMVASGFAIAAGAAGKGGGPLLHVHQPLPLSLRGPLALLGISTTGRAELLVMFGLFFASYLGVLALADSVRTRVGLGAIVALHLIFAVGPPLLSSDVFNYIGYARLDVVHDFNPYRHNLLEAAGDPTFPYSGWHANTTAYGPLFTLGTLPLGFVGLTVSLWVLKATAALASLGCVALVWACAKRLGRLPLAPVLFVGLNPVLLVYAVGGAHNDLLMMLAVLAGVYLLLAGRQAGIAGIVVAAAIKVSAAIVLPFAILGSRPRWRGAALALGTLAAIAVVSQLAFMGHVTSLFVVDNKSAGLDAVGNVPGLIDGLLGLGLSHAAQNRVGSVVFVAVVAFLLFRVWRGADWLEATGWAMFALLMTTTWLLPWYLVWFLPFAALARGSAQRFAALGLTALLLVTAAAHNWDLVKGKDTALAMATEARVRSSPLPAAGGSSEAPRPVIVRP